MSRPTRGTPPGVTAESLHLSGGPGADGQVGAPSTWLARWSHHGKNVPSDFLQEEEAITNLITMFNFFLDAHDNR